ncbi:MAG: carboxypeptidase-like regulatory domain-containing protein [Gemmatimonadaceae bacterium]
MIALTVRNAKSGADVSHALICLEGKDHWAITNEFGDGRVGNLPRGARRVRVEALGFAPESLVVDATRDDRRAAVIRLKPRKDARPTLSCD